MGTQSPKNPENRRLDGPSDTGRLELWAGEGQNPLGAKLPKVGTIMKKKCKNIRRPLMGQRGP